ncbi:MAG: alpha-amylase family protein [Nakamurella sp.]
MRITDTSDLWWKSAVIYCLDIETYFDANGDGVGDLAGLARSIDHLADLGVSCLWLMPFYPTPDLDDGYDVTDHYGVDPRLGNLGELVEVIRTAHDRGIRVIADLLVNHTSDRHPWFVSARRSVNSPYRDHYVWRDTAPPDTSDQVVFPDVEDSIWKHDERTDQWYLHHFYSHQPDLNTANPAVIDELLRVIGFWTQLGVDGFRVDAVPFLIDDVETRSSGRADPHDLLRELRAFLGRRNGASMLLGEVNLPHEQQLQYFGSDTGDQLQMMFDFITMQATYLAMARGEAAPLVRALQARPVLHPTCQWATFLRNHDELTLDKLTDSEREEVFAAFGPEESMQVFDRGLKRRLPPMLAGDPRRIRMAYSLLFSLPGTPCLYYGEEIGMGEDLAADGRMAVRTPMQWTSGRNGGFSAAAPRALVQPVVGDGYAPEHVNVADQRHDPESLLSFIRALIAVRRRRPEFGWGAFSVIDHDQPSVFAHRCDADGSAMVAVHNLGADPVTLELPISRKGDGLEMIDPLTQEVIAGQDDAVRLSLPGFGHRWMHLRPAGEPIS